MATRRRLAAIAFVDQVDSSKRISADEEAGLARRREVDRLVRDSVAEHDGRVVKGLGDGVMLEFESVVQSVRCARDVQRRMAALYPDHPDREPERVRIGIHVGDVVEEDGDLYGNAVNIAARLEKAALPGGICLSREAYSQVRAAEPLLCVPVPPERLTNLPEPVDAFEIRGTAEPGQGLPVTAAPQSFVTAKPERDVGWLGLTSAVALLISAAVAACLGIFYFRSVNPVFAIGGWLFASEAAKSGVRLIQRSLQDSAATQDDSKSPPPEASRAWKQLVAGVLLLLAGGVAAGLGVWLVKEQLAFSVGAWVFGGATASKGLGLVRGAPFGELEEEEDAEEPEADELEARELDQEARAGRLTLRHAIRRGKEPHLSLRDAGIAGALLALFAAALGFGGGAIQGPGVWTLLKTGMWGVGGVCGVVAAWMVIDAARSKFRLAPLDPDIVDACGSLADAPEDVSRALDRGIASFGRLHQILSEPVWKSAGIPARTHLLEGRRQLMAMLARGQQLQRVAATLERLNERRGDAAEYQAMRARYTLQTARLEAAADLFEQAEAEIARAYLAVTTQGSRSAAPDSALRDLPASFSAVAELLESLDPAPIAPLRAMPAPGAEQSAQVELEVGVGGRQAG